jgi:hypothetical protein
MIGTSLSSVQCRFVAGSVFLGAPPIDVGVGTHVRKGDWEKIGECRPFINTRAERPC